MKLINIQLKLSTGFQLDMHDIHVVAGNLFVGYFGANNKLFCFQYSDVPGSYNGPKYAADAIKRHFGDDINVGILDVASGTGLVCKEVSMISERILRRWW